MSKPLHVMYEECTSCRLCEGAAFQSPPLMGLFHNKPVLVVAQNPGMARYKETFDIIERMNRSTDAKEIQDLYERDLRMSYAAKTGIASLLGSDWLDTFDYTNAVRCRTPDNAMPSPEMIENCRRFTAPLINRYLGIIFIGVVARDQFRLVTKPYEIGAGQSGRYYLALPHYAARNIDHRLAKVKLTKFLKLVIERARSEFAVELPAK